MSDRNQRTLTFHDLEAFEKSIKRFEVEHYAELDDHDVRRTDIYQAMVTVAFMHEDELVDEVLSWAGDAE